MDRIPVTQETLDQLKEELNNLKKVERPRIITEIADARAQGDLRENAEYHAAKDRQGEIENRIRYLEDRVARSFVVTYDASKSESIKFGATVTVKNLKTNSVQNYQLVSPEGVDPMNGKISFTSPIGKALMGKTKGEVIEVTTPRGTNRLEIIDYK
ncbi:MAG: transcription elongation factor GreA [Fibrobacter sp.]|jgi:transcription elongation factor GreA|nr:transcription elongation factor GreA [Fibrobacter sp.]